MCGGRLGGRRASVTHWDVRRSSMRAVRSSWRMLLSFWCWSSITSHGGQLSMIKGAFARHLANGRLSTWRHWTWHSYWGWRGRKWLLNAVRWRFIGRYMDAPWTTGRLSNPDLLERPIEMALARFIRLHSLLIITFRVCRHGHSFSPGLYPLIRSLLNLAWPSFTFSILRQHGLVQLAKTLDHTDNIPILGVELLDLLLIVLVPPKAHLMTPR